MTEVQERKFIEIKLNFIFNKLEPKILDLISVGDKEIDENGQVIGEILYLGKAEPFTYEININGDKKLTIEDPIFKKILATLKIKAELRQNMLYYKDKQILLNSPIDFKTDKYQVEIVCLSAVGETKISEERVQTEVFKKQLDDIINRIDALEKQKLSIKNNK